MRIRLLAAAVALFLSSPAYAASEFAPAIKADYDARLGALFDWFHRNPELSFRETATAARMARELRAIPGMAVTEEVGGTGVVGVMRNGAGPTVLLRADMDGLPIQEASGLAAMSKARQVGIDGVESPVMHACGHDVHITAMVGTARRLAALRERWAGTVVFVVQPAEERLGGAKAMIDDGLYTRFPKPDYALAFHVSSELPTGTISMPPGTVSSAADSVDIIVHGVGAHGASPHEGRDPVIMGSQIVLALQNLAAREVSPMQPAVITVGSFQAGIKHNIISDRALLQLTVRADDMETRERLIAGIRRTAINVARMNGMPEDRLPEVIVKESTPVTINDPELTARLALALGASFGEGVLRNAPRTGMGAEDFAMFVQPDTGVRGVYMDVGGTPQAVIDAAKAGGPPVPSHHSPLFRIDPEPSVRLGAEAMTLAALDLLKRS